MAGVVVSVLLLLLFSGVHANPEAEALGAFKKALIDRNNALGSWDTSLNDPCTWFHITCNDAQSVTRVDLTLADLSGTLVPELGSLQNLQYLELNDNDISGTIPPELGQLTQLISLDLNNNTISGSIPEELSGCSNLKFIRLEDNALLGSIPPVLATMDNLQVLDLSNNLLSGPVPEGGVFSKPGCTNVSGNPDLCGPLTGKDC